jgi:simple sugar transport system ATP-binding protein
MLNSVVDVTTTPADVVAKPSNGSVVEFQKITKRFPGVVANGQVDLLIRPGEVHALLGENGAGKSTLIGVLAGIHQPDEGEILIEGRPVRIDSPGRAIELGIGTVYQNSTLVPTLTTLQNLMLGRPWYMGRNLMGTRTKFHELSEMLGITVDPDTATGQLALGQQQQVEIIKALWRGGKVLVLDEPTSMLTAQGVRDLRKVIERLKNEGIAVVFVTHKLIEAHTFGDRVTVLRRGRIVGEIPAGVFHTIPFAETSARIIEMLFGTGSVNEDLIYEAVGTARLQRRVPPDQAAQPILEINNISAQGGWMEPSLSEISFVIRPGEIFGIAGVDGNGQKQLAEVLAGQRRVSAGHIRLGHKEITNLPVGKRLKLGLSYISDDRYGEATLPSFSVAINILAKRIGEKPFWQRHMQQQARINEFAASFIQRFDVRTPSEQTLIGALSGGNIQKVVLGREFVTEPKIVVYNKPTYGLDLANLHSARQHIRDQSDKGMAAIVISTEMDELLELCDRIGVMSCGRLVGIIKNEEGAETKIGQLMVDAEVT